MHFSLPAFAKINLHLRVIGRREDGFHDIFTVFQTVSLQDTLSFSKAEREVALTCDDPRVPLDGSNLVMKAAEALKAEFGVSAGAVIHLEKRIPMGGGLGGGSSDAATALAGLSRLWGLDGEVEALARLGATLGSDVPFFLRGGTAFGSGRGTDIETTDDADLGPVLIVAPDVHVSTAGAYSGLRAENLTNEDSNRILRVCRSEAGSPDFLRAALTNDFERSVFAAYPEVGRVKHRLIELGASQVLMSGSGSSVFGIFDKEETRQTAMKALDEQVNWRKFAVAAVSRKEFRERMFGGA